MCSQMSIMTLPIKQFLFYHVIVYVPVEKFNRFLLDFTESSQVNNIMEKVLIVGAYD